MGYCPVRDIVTAVRSDCEYFEEATASKKEAKNREIYGQVEGEHEEEDE